MSKKNRFRSRKGFWHNTIDLITDILWFFGEALLGIFKGLFKILDIFD